MMAAPPMGMVIGTLPVWRGLEAASPPALVVHRMSLRRANVCPGGRASGLMFSKSGGVYQAWGRSQGGFRRDPTREAATKARSPDGARRNPGTASPYATAIPDYRIDCARNRTQSLHLCN